jgi:uncharacterized membrane protein
MSSLPNKLRTLSWVLIGAIFILAGANHLRAPESYLLIMPPYLPWPMALILVSGLAEMAGGLGMLIPATRRLAGIGLIVLLIAVFPANLSMAMHQIQLPHLEVPIALLWVRLPLQVLLIAWVWWTIRSPIPTPSTGAERCERSR